MTLVYLTLIWKRDKSKKHTQQHPWSCYDPCTCDIKNTKHTQTQKAKTKNKAFYRRNAGQKPQSQPWLLVQTNCSHDPGMDWFPGSAPARSSHHDLWNTPQEHEKTPDNDRDNGLTEQSGKRMVGDSGSLRWWSVKIHVCKYIYFDFKRFCPELKCIHFLVTSVLRTRFFNIFQLANMSTFNGAWVVLRFFT